MGHKHSTLHRQLKQQDVPSLDLVTATDSGGGGGGTSNSSGFVEVKQGPFRRKLSMRNISIRRSFHISKKSHSRLNKVSAAATTDDINNSQQQLPPSPSVPNGGSTDLVSSVPSTSTPVSLPRAATSSSRNGDKFVMDRLRKSFRSSFRRKKDHVPESLKPHQWQADELAVKAGNCMFSVKYLGCSEVYESRGMQVCEDALRRLRGSRRRPTKGSLYVTGDGLRLVDDETKGLIVDQTIEKVSFCAPDRSHERGFSYICRDGTTRRWMCHGFHATKDSGERLSHAVGCAFAVCLERKQKRDKEAVSSVFDPQTSTFTRTGSFRASSITERMQDPQVAKPADPVPLKPVHNPFAVERPHAAVNLLQRQGSLRGGPLNHVSPFKRQLSLRLGVDSLPALNSSSSASPTTPTTSISTSSSAATQRERAHSLDLTATLENAAPSSSKRPVPNSLFMSGNPKVALAPSVAPIQEVSPSFDKTANPMLSQKSAQGTSPGPNPADSSIITAMCQELSQGLTMLAAKTEDDLNNSSNNNSFSSWNPGHFSPPAALGSKDTSATSFTAFDKWISTNNTSSSNKKLQHPDIKPLVPPAVVDQMPQVTAPPPPSSPSYSTTMTSFSTQQFKGSAAVPKTDYHSALFSDLTSSLKENIISTKSASTATAAAPTQESTGTASISASSTIPDATFSPTKTVTNGDSITTNGNSTVTKSSALSNSIDPFDAGWAELTNRHQLVKNVSTTVDTPTTAVFVNSTSPVATTHSAITNSIPYKSTNPFLDLSQYETESLGSSASGSAHSVNSAIATPTSSQSQQSQQQQQIFTKAFEVHM